MHKFPIYIPSLLLLEEIVSLPKHLTLPGFATGNHIQQVKEVGHVFINVFSTENTNYLRWNKYF